jgi:hypothetical protein
LNHAISVLGADRAGKLDDSFQAFVLNFDKKAKICRKVFFKAT